MGSRVNWSLGECSPSIGVTLAIAIVSMPRRRYNAVGSLKLGGDPGRRIATMEPDLTSERRRRRDWGRCGGLGVFCPAGWQNAISIGDFECSGMGRAVIRDGDLAIGTGSHGFSSGCPE